MLAHRGVLTSFVSVHGFLLPRFEQGLVARHVRE